MHKKKGLIALIVFVLAAFAAVIMMADGDLNMYQLGGSIKKPNTDFSVVAKVNGENVYEKSLKNRKSFSEAQGKKISNQEAFDLVLRDQALIAEAKKRNLYPSDSETNEYIKNIRQSFDDARAKGIMDKDSEKQRMSFLASLGMTEEQYWRDKEVINGYRRALAIAKLRSQLSGEWGFDNKKLDTQEGIMEFENKMNDLAESLKTKMKIVMKKDLTTMQ